MKLRIKYVGGLIVTKGPLKGDYSEFTSFSAFLAAVNETITGELSLVYYANRQVTINLSLTTKELKGAKEYGKF